jgi:predicted ATPase
MINSIEIKNFRCFERLEIKKCKRINVLVGENGSGKTSLLEAIFFALGSSPGMGLRFRQARGLEGTFSGSSRVVEEAIWGDYFYANDLKRTIEIHLTGDGPEARSLTIRRGQAQRSIPLSGEEDSDETFMSPFSLIWKDASGKEHPFNPIAKQGGLKFSDSDEDLPDFFMFQSTHNINAIETAMRFSTLSRTGRAKAFIDVIRQEYSWIEDLSIEVVGGSAALFATVKGSPTKLPLANVSGGINRVVSILLAMSSRPGAVVLVDEIENGIYYRHQSPLWRGLLSLVRENEGQLFLSTHSEEWLNALVDAAGTNFDDIALWRTERTEEGPAVKQFVGDQVIRGIAAGEVR